MSKINVFNKKSLIAILVLVSILASLTTIVAYAANPILTRFLADPAVYYFNGKVYMYNTDDADNSGSTWDNKHWHAYSSTDLVNWTDEGQFWKVGSGGFTWASNYAWAPSAVYRNGFYYFYLPVDSLNADSISKVGVLRCTAPTSGCSDPIGGPLLKEGVQANVGTEAIDPQVFLDDDGQAYLYFGGLGALKVVKLNADMISLNGSITNVTATGYKESAWVHKYNGLYYLSYSTGWPGPIQYSTSTSPMGPWTFRGTILASQNTNTNHQSPLFYNGQWFLFYQKGLVSGYSNYRRNIAIDCMYYNTDGTIKQVVTTSGGVTSTSCGGGGPTPTTPPAATYYRITNRNSGKVIDVQQPNTSNNAKIGQYTWNSSAWQQWQFVDKGGGYFNIVSKNSGKCMDVTGASTADGAGIIQYTCGTGTNQQFQWVATGSYFNIKARHSGKCINVVGSATTDGALLEQRTCGTGNSFQWTRQ